MKDYTEVFVGIDTSKLRNAVAIAGQGRNGEIRYLGEIDKGLRRNKRFMWRRSFDWPQGAKKASVSGIHAFFATQRPVERPSQMKRLVLLKP